MACSKSFKVLSRADNPIYRQHEVETNVECPFCSKTNAIVWPQDESLPSVATADGQPSEHQRSIEIEILGIAKQLIAGQLGVIAGARKLSCFRHDFDPDLVTPLTVFIGIASETDDLPVGEVRQYWTADAPTPTSPS